ncbi:MAG: trigger factor [Candidatus Moranbacteria bacterium]|nr:trigger factor [Candidatus Moranbacteria bacterium]MBP6034462.1 trigger factor [Candidatus Moranbacteria bacterium]MBP7696098.1 trigger factor [Candidatus Moranbacteria bacterium]
MDIVVKKLPQSKAELSITLAWDEWKKEMDHAAEHMAKDVKIPGFRPGKVPRDVLEKRYGKEALLMEAAEHAVSHSYARALEQEKVDAIGQPEVKLEAVKEGESLAYVITTAVMPEVKLAEWKKAVKEANAAHAKKMTALAVEPKEIEDELNRLATMRAKFVTVARPAQLEDSVEVDFEVKQDGVVIEGGKSEKHPLVLGKGVFIPGFEEGIVGMQEGEEKTMTLSFPEDYHATHLAGKPAEFAVKLRLVQERQIPAIDDEFAKSLGSFETLEDFKKTLSEGILEEKKHKGKEEGRTAILDALVGKATIEFPEILVAEELNRMTQEFQSQVEMMGIPFEQYLEHSKKSLDDLRKDWNEQAKKRLSAGIILEKLADEDEVEIDSKEVEEEMNNTLQYYKRVKDAEKNIDLERLYASTRGRLRNEKVFEMLEKL